VTLSFDAAADAIVRLGRRVAAAGLVVGAGGNVSVRTGPDEILVTPSGRALDEIDRADLVTLGLDGAVRSGGAGRSRGVRPSSESPMHLAAHRARPDAVVGLHVHPPFANLLAATANPIRLITLDHAYYVRRLAVVAYLPSGSEDLADAVAAKLAANLEAAATATYRALLLGDTDTACPPQYLARVEAGEAATAGGAAGTDA